MAWSNPTEPNLADFATWLQSGYVGVPAADMPTSSSVPSLSGVLNRAMVVAMDLSVPFGPLIAGELSEYVRAVYNLGTHYAICFLEDQSGQTFFSNARAAFKINTPPAGVTLASGDETTSQTLVVPEFYSKLTLSSQGWLKTPWGREYFAFAQMYGPNVVGVS
jgi:hypothetical protein